MAEKPSYYSSTLAQLAVGSAVVYALGALLVSAATILGKVDINTGKALLAPFEFLLVTFGVSYLAVRKNGETTPPAPPTP